MKRLEIQSIITYLNTVSAITSLVGNRIFWGLPKTMQEGNSIAITEITDNIDEVESFSRIEFRIIGKDDTVNIDELYSIERALSSNLLWSHQFWAVKVFKVVIENNVVVGYDDKDRQSLIRDITFYYAN